MKSNAYALLFIYYLALCYTNDMQGPDNNISGFTKNLYLYITLGIAIIAGAVVYSAQQGNTESSLELLSKTSQRFARAVAACKTAKYEIDGKSYAVTPAGQPAPEVAPGDTPPPVLTFTDHAVRGNVNSDAYYDMVCTYDLTDKDIGTKSYVGVLFGGEGEQFFPGPTLLIGPQVTVNSLSISGGITTISYTEGGALASSASKERKFFLEGDTLSFTDNGKSGF